jgi:DNA-directed RNA polymerase subunit beta-beta'
MEDIGLLKIFNSFFPIRDTAGRVQLEFCGYSFDEPKYTELECRQRGGTYSSTLRGKFRLLIWDIDSSTGSRSIRDVREQEVYIGDIPLMTENGTFIFSGIERVIVSQVHRSPGIFIDHDRGKTHSSGKYLYAARIIPYRGSWIDIEFDHKDILYVRIDRRKKVLASTFFMCLESRETAEYRKSLPAGQEIKQEFITGMSKEEILNTFCESVEYSKVDGGWAFPFSPEHFRGEKLTKNLIDAKTRNIVANIDTKMTPRVLDQLVKSGVEALFITNEELIGKVIATDHIDEETGKIYLEAGEEVSEASLDTINSIGLEKIEILRVDGTDSNRYMLDTFSHSRCLNREDALIELCRILLPGVVPTPTIGEDLLNAALFDQSRYDLTAVGRAKINDRLGLDTPDDVLTLQKRDLIEIVKLLLAVKDGNGEIDDIDNLGNRRVRSVGELLENQCRVGMIRVDRNIREKMSVVDIDNCVPGDLINARPLITAIRDFFISSQLSQFMEQTNPLSEVTHKRRLSALGPGGLSRERAGFEVRDVHPTHYSRLCPVETPEGPSIGLINSLASFAKINKYGFIESPYRKVVDGKVTDEVVYLTASEELKYSIAPAGIAVDKDFNIIENLVVCRKAGEVGLRPKSEIAFVDVSPEQVVSVAAALIPFIENNDSTRALMGSNMQRQAVPLVRTDAPLVGTGMESIIARDSGSAVIAKRAGVIDHVDSRRIVVRVTEDGNAGADVYNLSKFQCSNMGTCINQKPLVRSGDAVEQGDIIADGQSIDNGELALGRNLRVAFMAWNGYSFEDSIILSESVVREDTLSSIHIESFEVMARDTKLGNEEITRDIPNLAEDSLRNLDEAGIVYIGAKVRPGDILVGKVTPKGETMMTPEEKLLRAIFGEKSADVRDTSLRVPPGISGTVVDVRVLMRRGIEKDERSLAIERQMIEGFIKDREAEKDIIERTYKKHLRSKLLNQILVSGIKDGNDGDVITGEMLNGLSFYQLRNIKVKDEKVQELIDELMSSFSDKMKKIQTLFEDSVHKLRRGDDLPTDVMKLVRVFVAKNRKIQPGDKMAGRHGNKGVVSKILPIEDMPYLEDGTPVDIILNPLGLPSRMNVGQILETHLGAAAYELGRQVQKMLDCYRKRQVDIEKLREKIISVYEDSKDIEDLKNLEEADLLKLATNLGKGIPVATPVFNGAKLEDIDAFLEKAGLDKSGQVTLYDGRTGEAFDRKVTVGHKYMMKLHHLVDDKIHARSVGPYSLVTQQPLGGKAQFGGQRFGEMEVWALEGYGAAHILREMLTVKSDDTVGRTKVYESIVKGENEVSPEIPESFNVLVRELRSLALNISFESLDKGSIPPEGSAKDFDMIRISVASPDEIRSWSYGEVRKPETINYRTFKPERDGLFCSRIFGPVKDYECGCGKYKRMKYKGIICEKCGVEVTQSRVRRERMGHIELAVPIAHTWFLRSTPSRISMILDRSVRELERILCFEKHVVIDPGFSHFSKFDSISENEYQEALDKYGEEAFTISTGAQAIRDMLASIDLQEEINKLREELEAGVIDLKKKKIVKRMKILNAFIETGAKPEHLVMTVLPVLPPELRPLVPLEGGRFAASDLNDLYRRVINRNNRLKRLLELNAPDIIVRNEIRMLQESVDALFDNKRKGAKAIIGTNKRPLKSLSDTLKGKQGRFRQSLLGKRVDYSGRSVIVVGPELKLHQCGLPKKMALELFRPFVYSKLEKYGLASNLKAANRFIERDRPEVWNILEEVLREHPVLLNRAPTLHRLSIQAFEPVLIEGKAIQLHPLVCTAFNADFDGDQMAVHVPLSIEAQLEARILMLSTNNILNPASGKPIVIPSKDMVLGIYYLTMQIDGLPNEGRIIADLSEIMYALEKKIVTYHTRIRTRIPYYMEDGSIEYKMIETTPGRVIFSQNLPRHHAIKFDLVNKTITSTDIGSIVDDIHFHCGRKATAIFVDHIMGDGFKYATVSGISYGKDDLVVPEAKKKLVAETEKIVSEFEQQYMDGFITRGEKYNKAVDAWNKCGDRIADELMKEIARTREGEQPNSVYMMTHSKARGSVAQLKQSAGMKGLVAKPSGEIIETPIVSNFKEGLTVLEYFLSTHGSRKGLSDTALKTANSGYLTRRLVDVASDCMVTEEDCGTSNGILVKPIYDGSSTIISIRERILGRFASRDIIDPNDGKLILSRNEFIDEYKADEIVEAGIDEVWVRSTVTCECGYGICAKCYGRDLAMGTIVSVGEAVGVIAAQSIGEPGTQLTLQTFHIGGAAQKSAEQSGIEASIDAKVVFENVEVTVNRHGDTIVLSKKAEMALVDQNGRKKLTYKIPYGSKLRVHNGDTVKIGQLIAEWDPYTTPVVCEISGYVKFVDLYDGQSLKEVLDESTGISNKVVVDWKQSSSTASFKPTILIVDESGKAVVLPNKTEARYRLPVSSIINVNDGEPIVAGDVIAKTPKDVVKTRDITGGLPRISELFEARLPRNPAVLSDIDGRVEFGKEHRARKRILVVSEDGNNQVEYLIPKWRSAIVNDGDYIKRGDVIVDGSVVAHDLLRIFGVEEMTTYFVNEIQKVYRLQGIPINDKHVEIIVRQMLRKLEIVDAGDSQYITGDEIDKVDLVEINEKLLSSGKRPIIAKPVLQGITKASLQTKSFISAASFQETARVLIEAAIYGKRDYLSGLKENVIIGRHIPAGTGGLEKKWRDEAKAEAEYQAEVELHNREKINVSCA